MNAKIKITRKKVLMLTFIALLIVAIGVTGMTLLKPKKTAAEGAQQAVKAQRGDLVVTVSGSGAISSSSKYDVTTNVNGTLTKINFKDGEKVNVGDLLFEIDDSDAALQIKQLENSIAQARLNQEYNLNDLKSNKAVAPIDGEVVDLQVKAGDSVSKGGTIMTITDKSRLKLLVSFNNTYRSKLAVGQTAVVNAYDTSLGELYNAKGRISSISSPSYKTNDGSEVYNVEVTVDNSSNLKEGLVANVELSIAGSTVKSNGSSTLSYAKSITVKSEAGGTVNKINVSNGQTVKKGDVLAELGNDDLQLTTATDNLKLEELEIQLETAEEKLADYKIYSPIDGTFTLNDVEQGNSIKQGDILGSVANYDTMEFDIDVDELDIAKIQVGQTADVTIDALTETSEKPLKGTVVKVAVEGTSSDGVSTYPVTIQLEKNTALKGGMNANAEIAIEKQTNALYVPIDAVQKNRGESFVIVPEGEGTSRKTVETGISNDQYIEIKSGLKDGDTVMVASKSDSNSSQQNQQGMGMMPMDGGGPPAGSQQRNNSSSSKGN